MNYHDYILKDFYNNGFTTYKINKKQIVFIKNLKYEINKKLLKVKNLDFNDADNNNLKLSIAYMNIEKNNLYGKDVVINLNCFGLF